MEYKDYKLEDVCEYVKERIPIEKVTLENYISTENLSPEKGGKQIASSLPKAKTVVSYQKGDTLISNIRPYFKKIWFSNTDGGSSGDVLVLRANKKINEIYLYYFLSQNEIFNYMVQTSKGTKMPRGDKEALMQYPIKLPVLEYQKKVSDIFSSIDNKIELNNSIISNLEELAQTLFKRWFVDFEFPNENDEPYKSSGGKMVESELGMIPEGWRVGDFNELIKIGSGKRPKNRVKEFSELLRIPVLGASKIMGYTDEILFNEPIIVIGRVGTHGVIQRIAKPCWPSDNTFVLRSEYMEFTFQFLKTIDYKSLNRGSTQPLLTQKDIKGMNLAISSKQLLNKFEQQQRVLSDLVFHKKNENEYLIELRDTLLPKLLSGEIELPESMEVTDNVPVS